MKNSIRNTAIHTYLINDQHVYQTVNHDVYIDDKQLLKTKYKCGIFYNNGLFYLGDYNGWYAIIDGFTKDIISSGEGKGYFNCGSNVGIQYFEEGEVYTGIFRDGKLFSKRLNIFGSFSISDDQYFVYRESLSTIGIWDISLDSIQTFSLLMLGTWLDGTIKTNFQVSNFCGIYKHIAVCTLNSGAILLIDLRNAQQICLVPDAKFYRKMFPKDNMPFIYSGLLGNRYIEFDVLKGQVVNEILLDLQLRRIKQIPLDRPNWFGINQSRLSNNLYYFGAGEDCVGVFDTETMSIVDYYEFNFKRSEGEQLRGGLENFQIYQGLLYCLDMDGNMYELTRE